MGGFLRQLEVRWDTINDATVYPFNIPALRSLETLPFHSQVTFIVGENGSGKSTLIEALAIRAGFPGEGGTKNFKGGVRPTESNLADHIRLIRGAKREAWGFFLRGETMFNLATEAEAEGYEWEDLHAQSHGEAFLWVMKNRFSPRGLYILDEPESALSPQRQLAALILIHRLVQSGSQFVIATHSPILMAYPQARILQLSEDGIEAVRLEDTEHYRVTRSFLLDPATTLTRLFRPSTRDDDVEKTTSTAPQDGGPDDE